MHVGWLADHTFVTWFLVSATFPMLTAMAYRCIVFGGRRVPGSDIDAQQTAFLAGGPRLAVYSALGELHGAGAIGVDSDRGLTRTAPLPSDATRLERAVYEGAVGGHTAADLLGHPTVSASLTHLHDGLEQAELLLTPSQRAPTRWFVYAELAVVAAGVVRVAADLATGTPIGDLLTAFVIPGIFLLFMAAVPIRTRGGTAVLAELRRQHVDLTPPRKSLYRSPKPSSRPHVPGAAGMGIGLFGLDSLWALDPVFAEDVGAPRQLRTVNVGVGG